MSEQTTKVTKKERFEAILEILNQTEGVSAETVEFIEKEIAAIEKRNAKDAERRAAAKEEGDQLREIVASKLTEELQTIDAIVAQVAGEVEGDLTKSMVVARLTQLAGIGAAEKEKGRVEGRSIVMYRLPVMTETETE